MIRDLTGMVFGKLTVISLFGKRPGSKFIFWNCICECGTKKEIRGNNLAKGHSKSCGCLQREKAGQQALKMGKANVTHGRTFTREYEAWHGLKLRCLVPSAPSFPGYGGRGITVCERWKDSFENFLADMGTKPTPSHQIDRVDPNGNYEPSNCRWVTVKEQQRNRRSNVNLTYNGKTQCIAAWAEDYGMSTGVLWVRLNKSGWHLEKALLTPVRFRRKTV